MTSMAVPTVRRGRRGKKGTTSVMKKLEESLEDGDFYSALQMYKTLLSRTSPTDVENAAALAEEGSVKLLKKGFARAATELTQQFVAFLAEHSVPVTDNLLSNITNIADAYPKEVDAMQDKLLVLGDSIDWSKSCGAYPRGNPILHALRARAYLSVGEFGKASNHFLFAEAHEEFAKFLVALGKRGFSSEVDLFILRVILQMLALENLNDAALVLAAWKASVSHDSPKSVDTPAVHLCDFLVQSAQRGPAAANLFALLEKRYHPTLERDPSFASYMQLIGHRLFGRPKPRQGGMMGMLSQMMGMG